MDSLMNKKFIMMILAGTVATQLAYAQVEGDQSTGSDVGNEITQGNDTSDAGSSDLGDNSTSNTAFNTASNTANQGNKSSSGKNSAKASPKAGGVGQGDSTSNVGSNTGNSDDMSSDIDSDSQDNSNTAGQEDGNSNAGSSNSGSVKNGANNSVKPSKKGPFTPITVPDDYSDAQYGEDGEVDGDQDSSGKEDKNGQNDFKGARAAAEWEAGRIVAQQAMSNMKSQDKNAVIKKYRDSLRGEILKKYVLESMYGPKKAYGYIVATRQGHDRAGNYCREIEMDMIYNFQRIFQRNVSCLYQDNKWHATNPADVSFESSVHRPLPGNPAVKGSSPYPSLPKVGTGLYGK